MTRLFGTKSDCGCFNRMKHCARLAVLGLWAGICFGGAARGEDCFADHTWKMANPFSRAAVVNATGDGLTLEIAAGNKGPILLKTDKPIAIPVGAKRLSVWANPAFEPSRCPAKKT